MNHLRKLRKQFNLSQKELGDKLNVAQNTISNWELGTRDIDSDTLIRLSNFFNVSLDSIIDSADFYGHCIKNDENSIPIQYHHKFIPLIGTIAAGNPIEALEMADDFICVDEVENVDFALHVRGDSMIGVGIYDGDTIFVRRQPTVENGEIAAVMLDEGFEDSFEATCKRFYKYPGVIVLRSENPKYKDIEIKKGSDKNVTVLGKVIFLKSYIEGR